jgi:diaminopimelate epimerase
MCGNGIRCLAKYVYDQGLASEERIVVETLAGEKELRLFIQDGIVEKVKVDMGCPNFKRSAVPMVGEEKEVINEPLHIEESVLQVTALSMGNPHCVIFVEKASDVAVSKVGPLIESLSDFPLKTNVEFVEVVGPAEINLRVWERGVGETLACGTGACAAVAAGVMNRLTGKKVKVHLPGGDLEIEWASNCHLLMTGQAEEVFKGTIYL